MSRISDLWKKLDDLNLRKKNGEDVQEEIDSLVKEMDEIRALA